MSNKIFVKDLDVEAVIGIFNWEREVKQLIRISYEVATSYEILINCFTSLSQLKIPITASTSRSFTKILLDIF